MHAVVVWRRHDACWRGDMLMILMIVFLVVALGGGGWGHRRYGYVGWSPAGLILILFFVLWWTGSLRG